MYANISKRQPELRLNPQELKQLYNNGEGIFTSHAYLYCLIRALRKDGWKLHIPKVSDFCKEWGFSDRSFYRAKNKLLSIGVLKEKIHGPIDLWIATGSETDNNGSEYATSGSETDNSGSEDATSGSEAPPEPLPDNTFNDSTPSSQLITPLSHSEPEREIRKEMEAELEEIDKFSASVPDTKPRGKLKPLATLLPSNETTGKVVEISGKGKSSAAVVENVDPDFLSWVIERVKKFPQPPTFPRSAAIALVQKSPEIRMEYEEYVKRLESAVMARYASLYTTPDSRLPTPDFQEDPLSSNLKRLQAKWNMSFRTEHYRQQVRQEIELHPEWGITINSDRLEFTAC